VTPSSCLVRTVPTKGDAAAADHLRISMSYLHPYVIPEKPPADLFAELDEATRVLDEMSARAAELMLGMDRRRRGLQIELREGNETSRLTSTQLLDLLAGK
jgi:hypothetical protein